MTPSLFFLPSLAADLVVSNAERDTFFDNVRLAPAFGSAGFVGYRVYEIESSSVLYRLGLRNNNIILSVNNKMFSLDFTAVHLDELVKSQQQLDFVVRQSSSEKPKLFTVVFKDEQVNRTPNKAIKSLAMLAGTLRCDAAPRPLWQR